MTFPKNYINCVVDIMVENEKERRKRENDRVLKLMKTGASLSTIPPSATWFPPRPTIEKDLSKLYPTLSSKTNLNLVTTDVENEDD